jgi:hypothetical protein
MKNLFLAVVLFVGLTTFAQEKKGERREKLTSEERVDLQIKRLTKELTLDEKQVKEVRILVAKEVEKREVKRTEMQAKKAEREKLARPSKEEMEARKAEMKKEQASMKAEMKKVLTADQYTKWEQKLEDRKEKMVEKVKEKRANR